jgi:tetratricopeptide (TPR) repeat protein
LLASARDHADERRWPYAYADYTRAADLQPDHYLVWSGRGSLYARLGLWSLAAKDYARALDLGAPATGPGWWGIPQVFLYAGDARSYREACTQMLHQADRTSDPLSTHMAVRSCLLVPDSVLDPAELAPRADKLLNELPSRPGDRWGFGGRIPQPIHLERFRDDPGPPPGPPRGIGWFPRTPALYLSGLAHYRAGHPDQAIRLLQEALTAEPQWPGRVTSYPILALAYHRTGQTEKARTALASAGKMLDRWTEEMVQGIVGAVPIPWFEWIELLLLYREAHLLLTGSAAPTDPRHRLLEQQGLTAIQPH